MHRLSHITIQNYRACRQVSIPIESFTPLVGQNNSGKSTVLKAIQWVLKPASLSISDFGNKDAPVIVSACIYGISQEVLDRIPEQNHRKAIEPYCRNERLWIRAKASGPGAKALSKEVWDIAQCVGDDLPEHWREYPTGLPQAVSVLLPDPLSIEAMEDVAEDLGKAKAGSTIKSLLDEIMVPILNAHDDLNTALESITNILTTDGKNRSAHLKSFDVNATAALAQFFPGLALDLDLQVVDVKELFKAGDLHVTDKRTGDRRRFDQIGTGAQRAIQMALIRYLADSRNLDVERPSRRLLLIDEPELYLHPQGVRRLRSALAQLAGVGFQIVFSTHSPMMLCRENAPDTIKVKQFSGKGVVAQKPLRQAVTQALDNAQSQSRTLFELGNLAEIYFSDTVVLCEGKTDRRLLPLAYERLFQHPPEADHIAFISLGSCADIPKALPVLEAMGIKSRAVADLDFGYTHARSGGLLSKDDQDLADIKLVLTRLKGVHGFTLNGNGLPQSEKNGGWSAADAWAIVGSDADGKVIALKTHEALKSKQTWVWPRGCIEQIIACADKGEDAILEQEDKLREMSAEDIDRDMPEFRRCFEWIKS
jgi:putative ATP-dependent endonuclease of the OLD family